MSWFPRLDAAVTWFDRNPDVLFVLFVSPMVGGVARIVWSFLS
jgi:hypothetical protein